MNSSGERGGVGEADVEDGLGGEETERAGRDRARDGASEAGVSRSEEGGKEELGEDAMGATEVAQKRRNEEEEARTRQGEGDRGDGQTARGDAESRRDGEREESGEGGPVRGARKEGGRNAKRATAAGEDRDAEMDARAHREEERKEADVQRLERILRQAADPDGLVEAMVEVDGGLRIRRAFTLSELFRRNETGKARRSGGRQKREKAATARKRTAETAGLVAQEGCRKADGVRGRAGTGGGGLDRRKRGETRGEAGNEEEDEWIPIDEGIFVKRRRVTSRDSPDSPLGPSSSSRSSSRSSVSLSSVGRDKRIGARGRAKRAWQSSSREQPEAKAPGGDREEAGESREGRHMKQEETTGAGGVSEPRRGRPRGESPRDRSTPGGRSGRKEPSLVASPEACRDVHDGGKGGSAAQVGDTAAMHERDPSDPGAACKEEKPRRSKRRLIRPRRASDSKEDGGERGREEAEDGDGRGEAAATDIRREEKGVDPAEVESCASAFASARGGRERGKASDEAAEEGDLSLAGNRKGRPERGKMEDKGNRLRGVCLRLLSSSQMRLLLQSVPTEELELHGFLSSARFLATPAAESGRRRRGRGGERRAEGKTPNKDRSEEGVSNERQEVHKGEAEEQEDVKEERKKGPHGSQETEDGRGQDTRNTRANKEKEEGDKDGTEGDGGGPLATGETDAEPDTEEVQSVARTREASSSVKDAREAMKSPRKQDESRGGWSRAAADAKKLWIDSLLRPKMAAIAAHLLEANGRDADLFACNLHDSPFLSAVATGGHSPVAVSPRADEESDEEASFTARKAGQRRAEGGAEDVSLLVWLLREFLSTGDVCRLMATCTLLHQPKSANR
ncbi:conserved hypothetical protein [Neospora caninum Liverpool]|uniref:Uncharacterized protein n=1 Tax=Neospora caninum (strain Liverpool) TaxID=572307 RepID=F0VFD7_NEOCL|nr:conserved hypothetical protein [Neospora caninum Liverpool]CBZ52431.1 conserved hypothetical protein [Neospora caninum Liverpool]|eukprot:XP_003882463.1 conserved hypothetical protein [Neospora caninum Liverpool]